MVNEVRFWVKFAFSLTLLTRTGSDRQVYCCFNFISNRFMWLLMLF